MHPQCRSALICDEACSLLSKPSSLDLHIPISLSFSSKSIPILEIWHEQPKPKDMDVAGPKTRAHLAVVSVVGVKLTQQKLRDMLLGKVPKCEQQEVDCYLLDDGGYVVLSSNETEDREVSVSGSHSTASNAHVQLNMSVSANQSTASNAHVHLALRGGD